MTKKEKVKLISKILNELFPSPEIPLKHHNTYTLLIAVLLSAHTTDAAVNRATPELFALADNPYDMANLSVSEIQRIIRSVGLSARKAKAISELSKILIEKYEGKVPDTFEELEEFPGVGHKTASVVMTQGFGHHAFPVDTHIHRCANRWGLTRSKTPAMTERALKQLFSEKQWNLVHLQIIYYARKFCPARGHKIEECPICSLLHQKESR